MHKKFQPIILWTAGLLQFLWAVSVFSDKIQQGNISNGIIIAIPVFVFTAYVIFALSANVAKHTLLNEKGYILLLRFGVVVSITLLLLQNIFLSPLKIVLQYTLFCFISGNVFCLGLFNYLEFKNQPKL